MLDYNGFYATGFWRNQAQQEIDYIEEAYGEIRAYEFKCNRKTQAHFSKSFINAYHPESTTVIHQDNYRTFILPT